MSKKITKEEFLNRFYRNYPNSKIELLEYTAISNPCKIKCLICGKIFEKKVARKFISNFSCCGSYDIKQIDKIKKYYNQSQEYEFIKQIDKDNIVVRHNKCGNEFKRTIQSCMDNPESCKYCNTKKIKNLLSIKEVQQQLDNKFFGEIQILEYNGQLEKNKYKCLKCGLIFEQKQVCLLESRGCPSCDRWKSKGEKFIANLLKEKNIFFKEQVSVKELPNQHFDFGIYDSFNNLIYFIEVQGEQHFEKREIFRDSLEKIQERDERKRRYCKEKKIPLYELIYKKGKFLNLDILPF